MAEMTSEISDLRERVRTLEQEVHENRALNRRLAELIDVVAELLLPATYPDEQRLSEALRRIADSR
jgi:cell shape-determining protein MreC